MSQLQETEEKAAVAVPSKPPLPTPPSNDAGSVKSDSFRHVDYTPSDGAPASKAEETLLGSIVRRLSGRALSTGSRSSGTLQPVKAPTSSEAVVEELTRRESQELTTRHSQDLPPLPPQNPSVKKMDSGRVGLQTVKLVALEQPTVGQTVSNASEEKKGLAKESDEQQPTIIAGETVSAEQDESKETKQAPVAPAPETKPAETMREGDEEVVTEQDGTPTEAVVRINAAKAESEVARPEDRGVVPVAIQITEQTAAAKEEDAAKSSKEAVAAKNEEKATTGGGETHVRDTVAAEKEQHQEQTAVGVTELVRAEAAATAAKKESDEKKETAVVAEEKAKGEGILSTTEDDTQTTSQVIEDTSKEEPAAPTLAAARLPGVGGSMKVPSGHESEPVALRHSNTTVGSGGSRPGFFRKLFSFGGGRESGKIENVTEDAAEEKEVDVAEDADVVPMEKEASANSEEARTTASVVKPSESNKSPVPRTEQAEELKESAAETEPLNIPQDSKHERLSSDLTPDELNGLKASLMDEMKKKGIEVEGKYTKSSADFDSPLMFLLDLHTFAETQQSPINMELLLQDKYGAETSIVTEFNEATAREHKSPLSVETKTKHSEPEEPKGDTSSAENYESGLDTAKDSAHDETKTPAALAAESSSECHTATTKQTEEEDTQTPKQEDTGSKESKGLQKMSPSTSATTAESKTSGSNKVPDDQGPPDVPRRDEATEVPMCGCFWCYCLAPKSK